MSRDGTLEASQVPDRLQRLVGRLDRLAIQLESSLGLDEADEFLHRIDIALFQKALKRLAGAVFAGVGFDGIARRFGPRVNAAPLKREALRVDELVDLEFSDLKFEIACLVFAVLVFAVEDVLGSEELFGFVEVAVV